MKYSKSQREIIVAEYYLLKLYFFCKKAQHEIYNYKPPISQNNDDVRIALLGFVRTIILSAYNETISFSQLEKNKYYQFYREIMGEKDLSDEHQFDMFSSYSVYNFIIRIYSVLESGNRTFFNKPSFNNYLAQFDQRLVNGYEILRAFRNTIHNNGKFIPTNGQSFNRSIYNYNIVINPGETFSADLRLIYYCAKSSIELFKKFALEDLDDRPHLLLSDPQYRMY